MVSSIECDSKGNTGWVDSLYNNCHSFASRYTEKVSVADLTLTQHEDDQRKSEGSGSSLSPVPPLRSVEGDASTVSRRSDGGDSTLSKTSDTTSDSEGTLEGGDSSNGNNDVGGGGDDNHFLAQLMTVFWSLHSAKPTNLFLTPMCQPGQFTHTVQQYFHLSGCLWPDISFFSS